MSPEGFLGRDRSLSGPVLWRACAAVFHARRHGAFGEIAPPRRCSGEAEFVEGPWVVAGRPPQQGPPCIAVASSCDRTSHAITFLSTESFWPREVQCFGRDGERGHYFRSKF